MVKLLTLREMELFRLAMRYAEAVSPVQPFPPETRADVAARVATELSFKVDEDDLAEMCEAVEGS